METIKYPKLQVRRKKTKFNRDVSRVITRLHVPENSRTPKIINRVVERFNQLKGAKQEQKKSRKVGIDVNPQNASAEVEELDDLVICRCEEITLGEIKDAIRNGFRTLNGIKRVTRAGMGLCQGQTCQRLVTRIITEELGIAAADIDPTTARGPVRPLRLEVFANS